MLHKPFLSHPTVPTSIITSSANPFKTLIPQTENLMLLLLRLQHLRHHKQVIPTTPKLLQDFVLGLLQVPTERSLGLAHRGLASLPAILQTGEMERLGNPGVCGYQAWEPHQGTPNSVYLGGCRGVTSSNTEKWTRVPMEGLRYVQSINVPSSGHSLSIATRSSA